MTNYKSHLNDILIQEGAAQDLKAMVKGDKDLPKGKVDRVDAIFQKYEKQINKIEKKYKLGMDELGEILMKL